MSDEALLREILDAQLEMVCRFRADGTILFVNQAYACRLDLTPADLTGGNLWRFVTEEDKEHVRAMLTNLTPDQPELTIENRFETVDGTRWMLWRNHAVEFDAQGRWSVAQSTGIDITERKRLEEQLQLLVGELNHRVKNTLMVVQAMAYQTFRQTNLPAPAVDVFNQRLSALSSAHDTLSRGNWSRAELGDIMRQGLMICGEGNDRVVVEGAAVTLPVYATVPLVMVLHELATNAMKYGALSGDRGEVVVCWAVDDDDKWLTIDWRESNGPKVSVPSRKGFGSRLVNEAVPRQLRGKVQTDYHPDGVHCTISIPLAGSMA